MLLKFYFKTNKLDNYNKMKCQGLGAGVCLPPLPHGVNYTLYHILLFYLCIYSAILGHLFFKHLNNHAQYINRLCFTQWLGEAVSRDRDRDRDRGRGSIDEAEARQGSLESGWGEAEARQSENHVNVLN